MHFLRLFFFIFSLLSLSGLEAAKIYTGNEAQEAPVDNDLNTIQNFLLAAQQAEVAYDGIIPTIIFHQLAQVYGLSYITAKNLYENLDLYLDQQ